MPGLGSRPQGQLVGVGAAFLTECQPRFLLLCPHILDAARPAPFWSPPAGHHPYLCATLSSALSIQIHPGPPGPAEPYILWEPIFNSLAVPILPSLSCCISC